jgi:hypothetical protein
MPLPYSTYALRNALREHTELVNNAINSNTLDLVHQNKFNSLSRQDQRIVEYYQQRVVAEQSLQKDIAKATTIATRIGAILEQVSSDLTAVLAHITDNTNPCTTGSDVGLTSDGSSSEAWTAQLTLLIQNTYHYVEAQHLGDYALLHEPVNGADPCGCVYRSKFYYTTPSSDCLAIPTTMGSHFTATSDTPTAPNDAKYSSTSPWQWSVSNPDLKVRDFYKLLVEADNTLWLEVLVAAFRAAGTDSTNPDYAAAVEADKDTNTGEFNSVSNRLAAISAHMEANSGLPQTMVQAFVSLLEGGDIGVEFEFDANGGGTYTFDTVPVLVDEFDPSQVYTYSDFAQYSVSNHPNGFQTNGPTASDDIGIVNTAVANYIFSNIAPVVAEGPHIANIEDPCDLQYITNATNTLLTEVNGHVDVNDREQTRMQYIKDNSETNESFFSNQVSEKTSIDTVEVTQTIETLQLCAADLKKLKPNVALSKQMLQRSLAGW